MKWLPCQKDQKESTADKGSKKEAAVGAGAPSAKRQRSLESVAGGAKVTGEEGGRGGESMAEQDEGEAGSGGSDKAAGGNGSSSSATPHTAATASSSLASPPASSASCKSCSSAALPRNYGFCARWNCGSCERCPMELRTL